MSAFEALLKDCLARRQAVGIWAENSAACHQAIFAVLAQGCDVMMLNPNWPPREIEHAVRIMNVGGILHFGSAHLPEYLQVHWQQYVQIGRSRSVDLSALQTSRASVLIGTSGSSGEIKGVQLSVASMLQHARIVNAHLGLSARNAWLCCLPLFHIGGLAILFRALVSGAEVVFAESGNTQKIVEQLDNGDIALISLVPTMLRRVLNVRGMKPFHKNVRAIIVGGGHIDTELLSACPIALPTYGMTECGSMISCARPGCDENERFSAGALLPDVSVRVIGEDGRELPRGEEGEFVVASPGLFAGYRAEEKVDSTAIRSGEFRTGDLGRMDERGLLHVTGRSDLQIKSGGEKIQPEEIVAALRSLPNVNDAIVVPLDDAEWGQVPAAFVAGDKNKISAEFIREKLSTLLPRRKQPKVILIREQLPQLANGKPHLRAIREELERAAREE